MRIRLPQPGKIGLVPKLILSQILLIAIPTIVFGIYFFSSVKSNMIISLEETGRQTVQRTLTGINRNAEICETAAQILINNKNFVKAASRFDNLTSGQLWELKNGLLTDVGRLRDVNPDIYRLCIYTQGADSIEAFPTVYSEKRISGSEVYSQILVRGGGNCWWLMHEDDLGLSQTIYRDNITSLYREVRDEYGRHIGIVEASMLSSTFFSELYAYAPKIDQADNGSFIFITDSEKNLIWNNGSGIPEYLDITEDLLRDLPDYDSIGESGSYTRNLNGKPVIIVYGHAKKIDSYVFNIMSIEMLAQNLNLIRNNIMLTIFAIIAVLSFVTYIITSALLKKVKIIKNYMKKVQYGDISVPVPFLGNDEIGELAGHLQKMMCRINELIALTIKNQEAIKASELKALHAQINSHFTYNTLDTIQMMAEVDEKYEIADAVNYLGKLMRYSADWKNRFSTLRDEIKNAENYISLINIKYDGIVRLNIVADDRLLDVKVPRMILQPVIENSIFHGIKPGGKHGQITIKVYAEDKHITIEIYDNGRGMDGGTLSSIRKRLQDNIGTASDYSVNDSIGLQNINERIRLYYGNECGLSIDSEPGIYTKVRITVTRSYEIMDEEVSGHEKSFAG